MTVKVDELSNITIHATHLNPLMPGGNKKVIHT